MCQLTFINLKSARLNRLALYNQWMVNTTVQNHDGFGLFNGKSIAKSQFNVQTINNFGEYLNDCVSSDPVIGHVRLATAVQGKKIVSEENSHPFENEKLVLAHNGVLEFKDDKKYATHKDVTVDSIIFMNELAQRYDGTNFLKAVQDTLDLFYGTFAFMIYSKLENKYFIIKGFTKKLHSSELTITSKSGELINKGIIINTEKQSLAVGLNSLKAILELAYNGVVEYTEPVELKAETVFEVDTEQNTLIELGAVKETSKPTVAVTYFGGKWSDDHTPSTPKTTTTNYYNYRNRSQLAKTTADLIEKLGLSLVELDYISYVALGYGICYLSDADLNKLNTNILPLLEPHHTQKKDQLWNDICWFSRQDPIVTTKDHNLKFPYLLNTEQELKAVLNTVKKDIKK